MIRFPAEWEIQSAVLIAWPHPRGDFGHQLAEVENTYRIIAETVSRHETLIIVCRDALHQAHIRHLLKAADKAAIIFAHAPVNDIWVRDTAPLSIETENSYRLVDFQFNGWGNKYPHQDDNALNACLAGQGLFGKTPLQNFTMVLEGGSVESDGRGTLMTTQQCLLNSNRNPELSADEIAARLQQALGAKHILWISQEHLDGDDTDAHIDTLARFCTATTIAYCSCEDDNDKHYAALKNMEAQLQSFRTPDGTPYQLTPLPLPAPVYDEVGQRLPANYANFLIINDAVLVPNYNDPMDAIAMNRLASCFPNREIIAIPCRPLVHQFGSLHCMTMQFPAAVDFAQPKL
ncbi:MAG: agmatine deiminase family protein [Gammaproteobacteria bacterium]